MAKKGRIARISRLVRGIAKWIGIALLGYIAILLVGLLPLNNGFAPPSEGVTIYLVSKPLHADIIVPRANGVIDWGVEFTDSTFRRDTSTETHVAIGWGDRSFFLKTPTWNDLKISTAANALLFPSNSCMHVDFTRTEYYGDDVASVRITQQQYQQLTEFIKESFTTDSAGKYFQIPNACYASTDAFFEAHGRYHALNTCNSWVGRGLNRAGVRVPLLTPMPKTPMLYLPVETDR